MEKKVRLYLRNRFMSQLEKTNTNAKKAAVAAVTHIIEQPLMKTMKRKQDL
jgi:L-ribulose-5-phosphate 3-epimerase UlaE